MWWGRRVSSPLNLAFSRNKLEINRFKKEGEREAAQEPCGTGSPAASNKGALFSWQHNLTCEIVFCCPWRSSLHEVSSHRVSPGIGLCGPAGFFPRDGLAGGRSGDVVCILLLAVHPCHGCCVEGEAGHEAGCGGQNLGCTLRAGMGMRRNLASLCSAVDASSLLTPRASICQTPVKLPLGPSGLLGLLGPSSEA